MAYTPTTWQTGDTITATAMNKIENGIANAGGGNPVIKMVSTNFGSYSHICGEFLLCTLSNGVYYPALILSQKDGVVYPKGNLVILYGGSNTVFVTCYPASVDNGNYVLIFVEGTCTYSFSGNISQEQVTIDDYSSFGHVITGDCTISMTE